MALNKSLLTGAGEVLDIFRENEDLSAEIIERRLAGSTKPLESIRNSELRGSVTTTARMIVKLLEGKKPRRNPALVMPWVPVDQDFSINLASSKTPGDTSMKMGIRNGFARIDGWQPKAEPRNMNGHYYVSSREGSVASRLIVPVALDEYGMAPLIFQEGRLEIPYQDMREGGQPPLQAIRAEIKALEAAHWLGTIDLESPDYRGAEKFLAPKPRDFPTLAEILEKNDFDPEYAKNFGPVA